MLSDFQYLFYVFWMHLIFTNGSLDNVVDNSPFFHTPAHRFCSRGKGTRTLNLRGIFARCVHTKDLSSTLQRDCIPSLMLMFARLHRVRVANMLSSSLRFRLKLHIMRTNDLAFIEAHSQSARALLHRPARYHPSKSQQHLSSVCYPTQPPQSNLT